MVAGDGPLKEQLAQRASSLGIADRTYFLGHQSDVQGVLDALDVFVLPSLWEAMPFSLLEAMSTGLPTVGTSVAGVPEVIIPDRTGFIVPPKDPAALALALRRLLDSSALRREFGEASRLHILNSYDLPGMLSKTVDVYRRVLSSRFHS